jgi:enamine deaminase RidA (YjgF/YER057c/UK114 family)
VIRISSQPGDTSGKEERMSRIEERLGEMGVTLPNLPAPIANYVPAKRAGNLVFTACQVSTVEGRAYKGKLGDTLSVEEGQAATRACVINCLAALKSVVGSLDHLKQIVAVHGLVNSTQDFDGQALVMNGASDFLVDVFGEAGKHIRTAVGVASLPMGFAASVYLIAEVE